MCDLPASVLISEQHAALLSFACAAQQVQQEDSRVDRKHRLVPTFGQPRPPRKTRIVTHVETAIFNIRKPGKKKIGYKACEQAAPSSQRNTARSANAEGITTAYPAYFLQRTPGRLQNMLTLCWCEAMCGSENSDCCPKQLVRSSYIETAVQEQGALHQLGVRPVSVPVVFCCVPIRA